VSNFIVFTLCSSLVDAVNTSAEPRIPEYDNAEITHGVTLGAATTELWRGATSRHAR